MATHETDNEAILVFDDQGGFAVSVKDIEEYRKTIERWKRGLDGRCLPVTIHLDANHIDVLDQE